MNTQIQLDFRPVQESDASMLKSWRNDEVTRQNSRRRAYITESAQKWLTTFVNERPGRKLSIALKDGLPVGLVYADTDKDGFCEVSYIVAPEQRGQGLGVLMVSTFVRHHLVGVRIKAFIYEGNIASEKIATTIGLRPFCRSLSEGDTRVLVEWQ